MHKNRGMDPEELEVLLDSSATPEEVEVVREAFTDAGLTAKVRPSYERKSTGELPWVVMVSVPLTAFLTAFAAAAGKDAYSGLKKLVRTVWDKRTTTSGPRGSFVIIDSESRIWVHLDPDIPADAYRSLAQLDLDSFQGLRVLKYDAKTKEWKELP